MLPVVLAGVGVEAMEIAGELGGVDTGRHGRQQVLRVRPKRYLRSNLPGRLPP